MKTRWSFFPALLVLTLARCGQQLGPLETARAYPLRKGQTLHQGRDLWVLFVGTQFTSANDLPGTFAALVSAAGRIGSFTVDKVVPRVEEFIGPSLEDILTGDLLKLQEKISQAQWDYVVLQDSPGSLANLTEVAKKFVDLISTHVDAKVVITSSSSCCPSSLETCGAANLTSMQDEINLSCEQAAAAVNALYAPAGLALHRWQIMRRHWHPRTPLPLTINGCSLTPAGTFLAACVIFEVVVGVNPSAEGLTWSGLTIDESVSELEDLAHFVVLHNVSSHQAPMVVIEELQSAESSSASAAAAFEAAAEATTFLDLQ